VRDFAPLTRDFAPLTRDFAPPVRDFAPLTRDFAPPVRDLAPLARDLVMGAAARFVHLGRADDNHRIMKAGRFSVDKPLGA
jgi:hypothetical protein